MVVLIEGQDTGFELIGCFHGPEHGVENLIIEGLSDIELDHCSSVIEL